MCLGMANTQLECLSAQLTTSEHSTNQQADGVLADLLPDLISLMVVLMVLVAQETKDFLHQVATFKPSPAVRVLLAIT